MFTKTTEPVRLSDRAQILDVLRGIALLGICLANYPVISLYIFQSPEKLAAFPTHQIDEVLAYVHFAFLDGKFYSLFSLLFGIGFAIMLRKKADGRQQAISVFYRRLIILLMIGLAHAFLLWEGDILVLYALLGMLLPLFRNWSDKALIRLAVILILLPLAFDAAKVLTNNKWNLATPFMQKAIELDTATGITQENAGTWLVDHKRYSDVLTWCRNSFFWRWNMLLDVNRLPKVFAMFLLGLYVGRKGIYLDLTAHRPLLKKVWRISLLIGLPTSLAHAYFELDGRRLPDAYGLTDTLFYALSVIPLSLFYTTSICLLYQRLTAQRILNLFAPVGRMALTNYLVQSLCGVLIFYGIGLGFGASIGVSIVFLISLGVYLFQLCYSHLWFRYFQFGPLEWMWKQLTYGRSLPIRSKKAAQSEQTIVPVE